MNIFFWVLQVALAWMFVAGGFFKIAKLDQLRPGVHAIQALPTVFWRIIGAIEIVAGLALVLPSALSFFAILTAFAALLLAIESVVVSLIYVKFKDFAPLKYAAVLGVIAVVVTIGRFFVTPF